MAGAPEHLCSHGPDLCLVGAETGVLDCVERAVDVQAYTRDGRYGFASARQPFGSTQVGIVGINRFDTVTGETTTFVSPADMTPYLNRGDLWFHAVSSDTLLWFDYDRVVRLHHDDSLIIVDARREGCPVVRDAAELARCGDPDLRHHSGFPVPLGFVGDRFVMAVGSRYYIVSDDDVLFLGDAAELADGMPITHVSTLPGGALLAQAWALGNGQSYGGSFLLDSSFRPLPGWQPDVGKDALGPWVGRGFLASGFLFFKYYSTAGSCLPKDDDCGANGGGLIDEAYYLHSVQWVEVPDALQPGEVVAASRATYKRPPPNHGEGPTPLGVWLGDGTYGPSEGDTAWQLWRVTALGAVTPWIASSGASPTRPRTDGAGRLRNTA